MLQAQRDLLAVLVDVEDHHFDQVVDLHHVGGVVDASPRHIGDVQEAVDAAEVDERAEVGDVLDGAGANLPRFDFGEKRLLLLFAGDFDELAARDDNVPPRLVDLEDHAIDLLIDVVGDIAGAADVDLAGGEEDVDADVDEQAALDLAGDLAADDVALVVLRDDHLPGAHAVRLLAGEDDLAGLVFHAFEKNLDGVTGLGRGLVFPLEEGDQAFRLVTDVDDDLIADDLDDLARDDAADVEILATFAEEAVEVAGFRAVRAHHSCQLILADVEFAKQITVDHGSIRRPSRALRRPVQDGEGLGAGVRLGASLGEGSWGSGATLDPARLGAVRNRATSSLTRSRSSARARAAARPSSCLGKKGFGNTNGRPCPQEADRRKK